MCRPIPVTFGMGTEIDEVSRATNICVLLLLIGQLLHNNYVNKGGGLGDCILYDVHLVLILASVGI